jgi:hypothetical protein
MLPAVQKFLGRVFAHREQECPSAKGSVSREVNKARKTGFQWPRIVLLGSSFALFSGLLPACLRAARACLYKGRDHPYSSIFSSFPRRVY